MASSNEIDTFGSYLRFLRRRARLTQTEFGIAVGYSAGQISMLENDQRVPDPTAVAALFISALGVERDSVAVERLMAMARAAHARSDRTRLDQDQKPQQVQVEHTVDQHVLFEEQELGRLEDIPPLPATVVARQEPLQRLRQWLESERLVAVCGMAGMGKSTLAAVFAHVYAAEHPVLWLTLSAGVNDAPESMLREIALFVAVHSAAPERITPFFRRPSEQQPSQPFQHLLAMVATSLDDLEAPLLVFDDAHLLLPQQQTLQALLRLAKHATGCRMLFVTREELNLPGMLHLNLGGLSHDEALTLVEQMSSATRQPDQPPSTAQATEATLIEEIVQQTGGSPMLIRLAVSHIAQRPSLTREALGALGSPLANFLLDTVISQLSPSAHQALAFLSIWRGAVDLTDPQLATLMQQELPGYHHRTAVATLQRQRLIDRAAYAAPHPLLAEPIVAELNAQPAQRRLLHNLAALWAAQGNNWIEAAHHYASAGDLQAAFDVIRRQDADTRQTGLSLTAASVVDEIVALARSQQHMTASTDTSNLQSVREVIRQLLILRGDLLIHTLRAVEADASYREAMSMTTETLARVQLADRLAQSLHQRGQWQDALDLCEQGLEILGIPLTAEAIRLRLELEGTRIRTLIALSRFDEAGRICEQALSMVRPVALLFPRLVDQVRASAYLALGHMARFQKGDKAARDLLSKSVKHARLANLRDIETDALAYLSRVLRDMADFAGAEETAQQALALALANGNDYLASNILHYMSLTDYYHFDLDRGLERSQRAAQLKQPMGDIEGLIACWLVQALLLSAQGKLAQAQTLAERTMMESDLLENTWLAGLAHYVSGIVLTFVGDPVLAEERLRIAIDEGALQLDRATHAGVQTYLGIALLAQGKLDQAQQVIDAPPVAGVGVEMELLRSLLQGMLELGRGLPQQAHQTALRLSAHARAQGYLVYAAEAERLALATQHPPALMDLPRVVCCQQDEVKSEQ